MDKRENPNSKSQQSSFRRWLDATLLGKTGSRFLFARFQLLIRIVIKKGSSFGGAVFAILIMGLLGIGVFIWYQHQQQQQSFNNNQSFANSINQQTYTQPKTKKNPSQRRNAQTVQECALSNNGNSVNIRANCDTADCDSDDSTIVSSEASGTWVTVLDLPSVSSSIAVFRIMRLDSHNV